MRSNEKCTIKFEDAETMYQATRTLLPNEDGSMDHGLIIGAYLGWALDEIERLRVKPSDSNVANGISWLNDLLATKSINSSNDAVCNEILDAIEAIRAQAKRIQELEAALIAANQRYQNLQEICDCQDENNRVLSDALIKERAGVIQAQDILMAERGRWTPDPSDGQKKKAGEQLRAEGGL